MATDQGRQESLGRGLNQSLPSALLSAAKEQQFSRDLRPWLERPKTSGSALI